MANFICFSWWWKYTYKKPINPVLQGVKGGGMSQTALFISLWVNLYDHRSLTGTGGLSCMSARPACPSLAGSFGACYHVFITGQPGTKTVHSDPTPNPKAPASGDGQTRCGQRGPEVLHFHYCLPGLVLKCHGAFEATYPS